MTSRPAAVPGWARALMMLLALLAWNSAPASAHLTPNSELRLDFAPGGARADIIVPLAEYAYATGLPTTNDRRSRETARAYLHQRIAARTLDGRAWTVTIDTAEFVQIAGPPDLHATATLRPPPGASDRRMTLEWSAVTDRVPTHFALLVVGRDLAGPSRGRQIVGTFTAATRTLNIDRGGESAARLFANSFALGARHIAEGYDHLLFLLALLLPAPLLAAGGRWAGARPLRAVLQQIGWVVTAFTLGHSLTLVLAAGLGWSLPVQPVEAAIAVSVLVSAVHAARPLFPGREPLVAFGFGTVHGLAFATLLAGYGLGAETRGLALAGFNIGIEAVQIALALVALPALVALSRRPVYRAIRLAIAGATAVAAAAWLVERLSGMDNGVARLAEAVLPWLGGSIAAASLVVIAVALHPRWRSPLQQPSQV